MSFQSWQKYESAERWASYFTQIDEVLTFEPAECLEIGVGNGIVTAALRGQGVTVTTLDLDPALHPDIIGSVEQIPLPDASVDVVLCAEVLEHLPFESFDRCLREISRVARKGAVISLPHWGYTVRCIIDLPGVPRIAKAWKLPISVAHPPGGEHFWEIGKKGYAPQAVRSKIEEVFTVEREGLSPWMPYHHFYRLRKRNVL